MQIVINIDDEDYATMKALKDNGAHLHKSDYRILKGTVLPKCHGRLIDADYFLEEVSAPTIIEADRSEE